jgi:hypothetical protein
MMGLGVVIALIDTRGRLGAWGGRLIVPKAVESAGGAGQTDAAMRLKLDEDQYTDDAVLRLILAEYQYVSQLIPLYRQLETFVLAGTGLVASAALAAFAALTSGQSPDRRTASIVLAAAAWGPALLLLVEITALTRITRASRYISRHLQPIAEKLTGRNDVLFFEVAPTEPLIEDLGQGQSGKFFRVLVKLFASSVGIQIIPLVSACALAVGGLIVDGSTATWLLSSIAIVWAAAAASYGLFFTYFHERRVPKGEAA